MIHINERHVSLSALDPTDVGTIQTTNVSELFLRPYKVFMAVRLISP